MTDTPPPDDPRAYREWVSALEQKWQAGLIPDPQTVAIVLVNKCNAVLLQLRDDNPNISWPNSWTLPGGVVESPETPAQAAQRELSEETGLQVELSLWKIYKRKPEDRKFSIEQHIFIGRTQKEANEMVLGEGQALQYFSRDQLSELVIAFDFGKVLEEFFSLYPKAG